MENQAKVHELPFEIKNMSNDKMVKSYFNMDENMN
jgi:hypothetical protein